MAIRVMVSADAFAADPTGIEVVTDYPGGPGTLYMKTTHVGLVLSTGEYNGYGDSDFYATVWNDAAGAPENIVYASTRGWTYPNGAAVDATPDVLAKFAAYTAVRDAAARALGARRRVDAAIKVALAPAVGKDVTVVRGRKVPKGTTGRVFWMGSGKFGDRVGIKDAAGTVHWTAATNVETTNPDDDLDIDALMAAERAAA